MLDISGWDFMVLAALGLILFGPDRLPKMAAEGGRFIRLLRTHLHNAKADLARELPPELSDMRLSDLTPRGVVRKALGDDPFDDLRGEMDFLREPVPAIYPVRPLDPNEVPPYDADST